MRSYIEATLRRGVNKNTQNQCKNKRKVLSYTTQDNRLFSWWSSPPILASYRGADSDAPLTSRL